MATITFSTIPIQSLLVPTVTAELDPSGANNAGQVYRSLIIGTMLASGTATANVPVLTSGASDAETKFGIGSMAAMMVADYRNQDPFGELWVLPIALPSTGSATTATMTLTGPATSSGNLYFYLGGQLIQSAVTAGDTATVMATNLVAAAALVSGLPATLAAAAGVITITPIDKTISGSDIDLQMNYLGTAGGQALPAGVTVAFSAPNVGGGIAGGGGVANPSIAAGLANLGSQAFDFIATGLNDATNLGLISSLLNDESGRWSWIQELFGHAVAFHNGSLSQQAAFVAALNDQHLSVFGGYKSPWPRYRCAADVAGEPRAPGPEHRPEYAGAAAAVPLRHLRPQCRADRWREHHQGERRRRHRPRAHGDDLYGQCRRRAGQQLSRCRDHGYPDLSDQGYPHLGRHHLCPQDPGR